MHMQNKTYFKRASPSPPPPLFTHSQQPLKVGGGRGEGRGGGEELRTLLEHKGNGNVELRRFLGCSVASLRLAASLPLPPLSCPASADVVCLWQEAGS